MFKIVTYNCFIVTIVSIFAYFQSIIINTHNNLFSHSSVKVMVGANSPSYFNKIFSMLQHQIDNFYCLHNIPNRCILSWEIPGPVQPTQRTYCLARKIKTLPSGLWEDSEAFTGVRFAF